MLSYHTQSAMSTKDAELVKIINSLIPLLAQPETPSFFLNETLHHHSGFATFIEPIELRQIFIRNIPFNITAIELVQQFSKYGMIEKARIITEKNNMTRQLKSRGFGFITFYKSADANKALAEKYLLINERITECYLAANGLKSRPMNARLIYKL